MNLKLPKACARASAEDCAILNTTTARTAEHLTPPHPLRGSLAHALAGAEPASTIDPALNAHHEPPRASKGQALDHDPNGNGAARRQQHGDNGQDRCISPSHCCPPTPLYIYGALIRFSISASIAASILVLTALSRARTSASGSRSTSLTWPARYSSRSLSSRSVLMSANSSNGSSRNHAWRGAFFGSVERARTWGPTSRIG
jgi:hypothetical protein